MTNHSNTPLNLPPGITEQAAISVIEKYAPLIRLHANELHLPSNPEFFRVMCRFRMSRPRRDAGWNKISGIWKTGDRHSPEYHAVPWDQIVPESATLLHRQTGPNRLATTNLRPRDDNNVYGDGSQRGLFLQRSRELHDKFSGMGPTPENEIAAPVFIDTVYNAQHSMLRVLFWFFYELNHWRFMITHEGDWEHITMVFREEDFKNGQPPECVYFAQHNVGHPVAFDKIDRHDETHCIVYVHRHGHPCHARVDNAQSYKKMWKTWEVPWVLIPRAEWRDYAGAWGEVGETKHTTGPLGPHFKRFKDNVPIKIRNGKAYVVLKG